MFVCFDISHFCQLSRNFGPVVNVVRSFVLRMEGDEELVFVARCERGAEEVFKSVVGGLSRRGAGEYKGKTSDYAHTQLVALLLLLLQE